MPNPFPRQLHLDPPSPGQLSDFSRPLSAQRLKGSRRVVCFLMASRYKVNGRESEVQDMSLGRRPAGQSTSSVDQRRWARRSDPFRPRRRASTATFLIESAARLSRWPLLTVAVYTIGPGQGLRAKQNVHETSSLQLNKTQQ